MINFLKIALNAASLAGDAVLKIYNSNFDVEYKNDKSPLTKADIEANKIITEKLSALGYPIISEECAITDYELRSKWNRFWLIDPIDGTKGFIEKTGEFTINIALMENNIPIIGVILCPVTQTFYFGFDKGSYKATKNKHYKDFDDLYLSIEKEEFSNFKKISVSSFPSSNIKVVMSKSHINNETLLFISEIESVFGKVEKISYGSSIKICLIAEGVADIYPRLGLTSEWDIAAADAILRYAGGSIFKYDSRYSIKDYISSNNNVQKIKYNKENMINPYFIVSGLHKYNV